MIKLKRHEMPQEGVAFIVMPYGAKSADGTETVNFDELYERVYADTIAKCGMRAVRADGIWGSDRGILDVVWRGIQTAEVVIVDCSGRSIDVGLELGLSMALSSSSPGISCWARPPAAGALQGGRPGVHRPGQGAGKGTRVSSERDRHREHLRLGEDDHG